jgi:hypothetical protein
MTPRQRVQERASKIAATPPPIATIPRRVIAPYSAFPVEHLPPVLQESVLGTAKAVGCDPTFAALPALVLAGAAIGATLAVSPKKGFVELPIIWAVVVGDSGTAKSPAADPYSTIAQRIEDDLYSRFLDEVAKFDESMDESPDEKSKPVRPYFLVEDITIERLVENLNSSPRGLLLFQDELANWFGSFGRYKSAGGGSDSSKWLQMFDGRSVNNQRRTGTPRDVRVRRAAVCVSGGIQPDILRTALSNPAYIASGLAARLLFAMPPKHCPRWSDAEPNEAANLKFGEIVSTLRKIQFNPKIGPIIINLESEAHFRYVNFSDSTMARAENLDGGPMASALPKLARYALRFALVHHAVSTVAVEGEPWKSGVTKESMIAGIALAEWFAAEAERVYSMLSENPDESNARRLAELIRRKGGTITLRDLQRARGDVYTTASAAELALEALVTDGWGEWRMGKPEKGGHSFKLFALHPTPDTRPGNEP